MRPTYLAALCALAAAGLACGGGGGGTAPSGLQPSTTYLGMITAGDGTTAGLSLTFGSAVSVRLPAAISTELVANAVVSVTGVATVPNVGAVALTGSINNGALTVTGGGYTLTGTLQGGRLSGTFSGPGGAAGSFAALSSTDAAPAHAYCGYYNGVITPGDISDDGYFNMVVAGTVLSGAATGGGGDVVTFTGTAAAGPNGTTAITVNQTSAQGTMRASGSITASYIYVDGTYQSEVVGENAVNNGTFSGALCPGTYPTLR